MKSKHNLEKHTPLEYATQATLVGIWVTYVRQIFRTWFSKLIIVSMVREGPRVD